MAKIENSHRTPQISQNQGPYLLSIFNENYNNFLLYLVFLGTNGPSFKDQEVTV